jgi:serine protease Do
MPARIIVAAAFALACFSSSHVRGQEQAPPEAAAQQRALLQGQILSPKAFRAATAKVMPSVVTIESFGGLRSTSEKGSIGGISKPGEGPTTGLIISADGYVLTSTFNFIRQQPIITVVRQDGTRHVAKLLGRDETRKLCILKIENAKDLPVPEIAKRDELRVGQWAISVGVGFGDTEPAISAGIISARNRISGRAEQTDANVSPANYGGPLIDIEGRVIGICVPLNPQSQELGAGVEWYDSGIGFAVPLDGAEKMIAAMKAGKTVQPAQLGVQVKPGEGDEGGVLVEKLMPDSAAAKAGLKEGDRIVKLNDDAVVDPAQLRTLLGAFVAGDKITVVVKREGMEVKIEVTLDAAKAPQPAEKPELPFKLPMPRG